MKKGLIGASLLVMLLIGLIGMGSAMVPDQDIFITKTVRAPAPIDTFSEGETILTYTIEISPAMKPVGATTDVTGSSYAAGVTDIAHVTDTANFTDISHVAKITDDSNATDVTDATNAANVAYTADATNVINSIPIREKPTHDGLVTNGLPKPAYDVLVTDKLPNSRCKVITTYPPGIVYTEGGASETLTTNPASKSGNYYIPQTGDILQVFISEIKQYPVTITFSIKVPRNVAPDTLYNSVMIESRNDPNIGNNYAVESTYLDVPYDQRIAIESFEDLLKSQTGLLASFEDLIKSQSSYTGSDTICTRPECRPCPGTEFVESFENLLRTQTRLYSSFEDLLYAKDNKCWNEGLNTRLERAVFLKSYEDLLRKEAFLFLSFETILKTNDGACWRGLQPPEQRRLLASFEDLLKRQVKLYKSFETLEKKLDAGLSNPYRPNPNGDLTESEWRAARIDFLRSFEDLLRLQANLYGSFEGLLKATTFGIDKNKAWEAGHPERSFAPYPVDSGSSTLATPVVEGTWVENEVPTEDNAIEPDNYAAIDEVKATGDTKTDDTKKELTTIITERSERSDR